MVPTQPRMVEKIKSCRVCHSVWLKSILNFGNMPLANRYLSKPTDEEIYAHLEVMLCKNCGCVQLANTVDPAVLFSDYLYISSTSGSLALHFAKYAKDTAEKLSLVPGKDFIVGIGGNDGPLESAFQQMGFNVLNVEASKNIAELSRANRVPTISAWFNEKTAESIANEHGLASLVTCNNCFAHMPDINGAVEGVKTLLKPGGWFVCEEGYWPDAVKGNHFDRVYHEHVFYWTVTALSALFRQHEMDIVDVEHNDSQGGSIRVFARHDDGLFRTKIQEEIHREKLSGVFNEPTYEQWNHRIACWGESCWLLLHELKSICCYGVPAKFAMLSHKLGFTEKTIAYAVEDSPIKVGRFTPGSHIPIVNRQHFIEHPTEHCIITAANYAELIIASNPQYLGRWIVLNPEPRFL